MTQTGHLPHRKLHPAGTLPRQGADKLLLPLGGEPLLLQLDGERLPDIDHQVGPV